MSYVLIGEALAEEGPLFVLWTRDASGVRVLPIASHDRRDMQAVGRRLIEESTTQTLESIVAGAPRRADGGSLRLVDIDASQREAIARQIASDLEDTGMSAPADPAP
jgi:hypothetical protein